MDDNHRRDLHMTEADLRRVLAARHSFVIADDGSASQEPNEYNIWTPRSWSDDDSLPASSIAGKSTDLSKLRDGQGTAQVPQELLEVIERQDAVIERLVTWCQTLEDQAIAHRMKLVEHEKAKDESANFRTTLRSELATLKKTARKKAKEHSLEANELYERMQSKVDSRVSAWCSRQEGICNRSNKSNRAGSPPRIGSPRPASRMQGVGSSELISSRSKTALGTATSPHGPSSKSSGAAQRLPARSQSMADLVPAAKRSSPLREDRREAKCFESSASPAGTRLSKRNPSNTMPLGQRTSSNASQNGLSATGSASTGALQASMLNSVRPEVQKVLREGVSPRGSLNSTQSKTNLGEPVPPTFQQDRWNTPSRARQTGNKASEGSRRSSRQPPTSPGRGASKSSHSGASDSMGQGLKFLARSVSPPSTTEDRLTSPKRSPRQIGDDSSASRSSPRRSPLRQGTASQVTQYQEKGTARPSCSKSSFAPPPRVGGAGTAGLVMQSYPSLSPRIAQMRIPAQIATPPPSPSNRQIVASKGNLGMACPGASGNAGLVLTPQSSMAAFSSQSTGELPSPRRATRGTCPYNQATSIVSKPGRSR